MLKLLHCATYAALSGAYAASLAGFDKEAVTMATVMLYLVLALDAWYRH
jgi:hypothetical protein